MQVAVDFFTQFGHAQYAKMMSEGLEQTRAEQDG
jgi:hypothetical protein